MSEDELRLPSVSDDEMEARLAAAKPYTIVLLSKGPAYDGEGARTIIWEHGRRNFGLRADGVLNVVCPMGGEGEVRGIGIFDTTVEETERILAGDPAIVAGVLRMEVREGIGFPGDALR